MPSQLCPFDIQMQYPLGLWSSNQAVHKNHLRSFPKYRFPGPTRGRSNSEHPGWYQKSAFLRGFPREFHQVLSGQIKQLSINHWVQDRFGYSWSGEGDGMLERTTCCVRSTERKGHHKPTLPPHMYLLPFHKLPSQKIQ